MGPRTYADSSVKRVCCYRLSRAVPSWCFFFFLPVVVEPSACGCWGHRRAGCYGRVRDSRVYFACLFSFWGRSECQLSAQAQTVCVSTSFDFSCSVLCETLSGSVLCSPALYFETGVLRRAARRHGNGICAFASNNSNSTPAGERAKESSPRDRPSRSPR